MARNISAGARCAAAAFSILGFAGSATAQDFCAGLNQAIRHAPTKFAAIKLSNRPLPGKSSVFPARRLLPGSVTCVVEGGDVYKCYMARNASLQQAREAYARYRPLLERCVSGAAAARMPNGVLWSKGDGAAVTLGIVVANRDKPVNSTVIGVLFDRSITLDKFLMEGD